MSGRCSEVFVVGCSALKVNLFMVAFWNAQDKESAVLVLCSTNTPPKNSTLLVSSVTDGQDCAEIVQGKDVKKKMQLL